MKKAFKSSTILKVRNLVRCHIQSTFNLKAWLLESNGHTDVTAAGLSFCCKFPSPCQSLGYEKRRPDGLKKEC